MSAGWFHGCWLELYLWIGWAVSDAPRPLGFVFIALFLAALFLQRTVPAT